MRSTTLSLGATVMLVEAMMTSSGSSHTTSSQVPAGTLGITKRLSASQAPAKRARPPFGSFRPTQHFGIGAPL